MIERTIPPAGDPFTARKIRRRELEERLAHELLPDDERQELKDLALRPRRVVRGSK